MIIPINSQYRIAADRYAWMVQEYAGLDKSGKDIWHTNSWHISVRHAVESLAECCIRLSEAKTVADAIEEVKAVSVQLTKALTPVVQVKL